MRSWLCILAPLALCLKNDPHLRFSRGREKNMVFVPRRLTSFPKKKSSFENSVITSIWAKKTLPLSACVGKVVSFMGKKQADHINAFRGPSQMK